MGKREGLPANPGLDQAAARERQAAANKPPPVPDRIYQPGWREPIRPATMPPPLPERPRGSA